MIKEYLIKEKTLFTFSSSRDSSISDKISSNDVKLKEEMSCCIQKILRVKNGFLNFGDCKSSENNNLGEFD